MSSDYPPRATRLVIFEPPKQRQRWGDNLILPHANWGDLFLDLYYVAAAYNLSYLLLESPSNEGILYLLGLFGPILVDWFTATFFDARFSWGADPWHGFLELARICFLATAVVHIRTVDVMSQPSKYPDMFGFSLGVLCLTICNIYDSLEVRFKVVGEKAAKYSERGSVFAHCVMGVFYLASTCIAGVAYFGIQDEEYNEAGGEGGRRKLVPLVSNACSRFLAGVEDSEAYETSSTNVPIILCVVGWMSSVLLKTLQLSFWKADEEHKKYNVPLNIEFCIHRFGELTMLLLGESILSLLIVETYTNKEYYITLYAGIISTTMIQYLHFKYTPHSAEEHAMRRSFKAGACFYVFFIIHSFALVTLGTSYKMFLTSFSYEAHNADPSDNRRLRQLMALIRNLGGGGGSSKYSKEERQQRAANMFCCSMAVAWVSMDLTTVCHQGIKSYFEFAKSKAGLIIVIVRLLVTAFVATLSTWIIEPDKLALLGMAAVLVEVAISVFWDYYFSFQDNEHRPNVTEPVTVEAKAGDDGEEDLE